MYGWELLLKCCLSLVIGEIDPPEDTKLCEDIFFNFRRQQINYMIQITKYILLDIFMFVEDTALLNYCWCINLALIKEIFFNVML